MTNPQKLQTSYKKFKNHPFEFLATPLLYMEGFAMMQQ
jgi:hypothetical protein